MNDKLHHIRLVAGLEIDPGSLSRRVLTRRQADELAAHLSADLARVVPEVRESMLVVGGSLLEPTELIRPGYPVWQALEELTANSLREGEFQPQIMAIGAFSNRMPHSALQPPAGSPQGQFIALPLLLVCQAEGAEAIESALEDELFERGSMDPPARAVLSQSVGMESIHGQLLTLADLVALQHVQLDSAGLGAFWPAIEHVLLESHKSIALDLPANLDASWNAVDQIFDIRFESFNQADGRIEDYALWLRALRTLTALLEAHGVAWRAVPVEPVVLDREGRMMIEAAGSTDHPDCLTVHNHPDLGLVCWSVVEDGRLMHLYPLNPAAAGAIERDLAARGLPRVYHCDTPNHDPETGRLQPATEQ